MKTSASCGVDGLTSRLLKTFGPSILSPLLHLINSSIRQRTFPQAWKTGCITPPYKEGLRTDPSNYCPISILPCLGKILEKVVYDQFYAYLCDHHMLFEGQLGFREGYFTGTCLVIFLDYVFKSVDNGVLCGVLFLHLRKAFDTVDHKILLEKLRYMGFRHSAIQWVESYLYMRQQVTKIDGELLD